MSASMWQIASTWTLPAMYWTFSEMATRHADHANLSLTVNSVSPNTLYTTSGLWNRQRVKPVRSPGHAQPSVLGVQFYLLVCSLADLEGASRLPLWATDRCRYGTMVINFDRFTVKYALKLIATSGFQKDSVESTFHRRTTAQTIIIP